MAAASVESYRFVVLRSPVSRFGSLVDVGNRLRRVRGCFQRQIHLPRCISGQMSPTQNASETGTREASGPTVEPPETNEDGHEDEVMEAVTKALKAARDAYDSTGELSRKTRSALVEMRHEAYKSAAEIVDPCRRHRAGGRHNVAASRTIARRRGRRLGPGGRVHKTPSERHAANKSA